MLVILHRIGLTVGTGLILASCSAFAADADIRALLCEHIKNPEYSLDRQPEYVVTDPAFIEPVLDQALKYINLSKPLSPSELARARQSAVTYYRLGLQKPDGLAALEARIAARFTKPVITRSTTPGNPPREAVEIDYGWMTGPLTYSTRYGIEHDRKSENLEGWGPSTRVLADMLINAARAYPTVERITLAIVFPRSRVGRDMRITYVRTRLPGNRDGWVILGSNAATRARPQYQVWVKDGDFSPYREDRYSFYADCAPFYSAARAPQAPSATPMQRKQCLNYAESNG